ncbi:hypothetical protein J1N35_036151 [Gossypium stocksii]|uniref:Reverse transcriptase zinc-binding domain-containing protein n=1 Tax=Gossypium stocksii TaxID=47602 RepID=A0A9D3UHS2_9ROSI|nr:hypothetical protein J1N35_036151 [Gossypium stocksii]
MDWQIRSGNNLTISNGSIQEGAGSVDNGTNRRVWALNNNGEYLEKSRYEYLAYNVMKREGHYILQEWTTSDCKTLWKFKIPYKIILFLWKIGVKVLTCKEELGKRFDGVDMTCSFCGQYNKSYEHFFLFCDLARAIKPIELNHSSARSFILHMIIRRRGINTNSIPLLKKDLQFTMICILWNIWIHRNEVCFKGHKVNPIGVIRRVQYLQGQWVQAFQDKQGGNDKAKHSCGSQNKIVRNTFSHHMLSGVAIVAWQKGMQDSVWLMLSLTGKV